MFNITIVLFFQQMKMLTMLHFSTVSLLTRFITPHITKTNFDQDAFIVRWSEKALHKKQPFSFDALIFYINMSSCHWLTCAIFPKEKQIEMFDGLCSPVNGFQPKVQGLWD